MSFLRVRMCWYVLLVATLAIGAVADEALDEESFRCDVPTHIDICGMRIQVVPRRTGGTCLDVCAGGTFLQRSHTRWASCLVMPFAANERGDEVQENRCVAQESSVRVEMRCSRQAFRAHITCDPSSLITFDEDEAPLRARRQAPDDIAEGTEKTTSIPLTETTGLAKQDEDVENELENGIIGDETDDALPTGESVTAEANTGAPITEGGNDGGEETTTEEGIGVTGVGGSETLGSPNAGESSEESDLENTLTIALAVLVCVLLVALVVGGVFFWRWRQRASTPVGTRAPGDGAEDKPLTRRVAVSALEAYVADAVRSEELRDQHVLLPRGCVRPALCARRPENRRRNRYNDLVAYDDTRVVLKPFPGEEPLQSDYINANYIDGYARPREFIAAQAPLSHTAADFWRLLWQERVRVVATLCAAREAGVEKCFQYWPSAGDAVAHGPFAITCAREDSYPDLVVRELRVARAEETRQVVQIQFSGWPDHGVPRHPQAVTAVLRRLTRAATTSDADAQDEGGTRPILVHCSAGVGRTGTVLLALTALAQARTEGAVDVLALLQRMRRQRPNLVDQAEQYVMAHRVLVDALLGASLIWPADAKLSARVREAAAAGELHAHWRRLEGPNHRATLQPSSRVSGSAASLAISANGSTAGSSLQLAGSGAPKLLEMDGYRTRARFVAMPAAAPASAWRQVAARGLRVAVLLQDAPEGEGPWPMAPPAADVGVRLAAADVAVGASLASSLAAGDAGAGGVLQQRLELRAGGSEWRSLHLLRPSCCWPTDASVPEGSARSLVQLWRALVAAIGDGSSVNMEPVLLLCADGRRGCGLLVALCALLEQIQAEGEVCVAEAVLTARRAHDALICSEEQLLFLYEAVVLFVEDTLSSATR